MTGGPFTPISVAFDTNGSAYPGVHVGASNSRRFQPMFKVGGGLQTATDIWLMFQFPKSLPSGQAKLDLHAMANATVGSAIFVPSWASVGEAENPDTATLNSEGTQAIDWNTNDEDDIKTLEFNLDADTPVAGEFCMVQLQGQTGWTLAVASSWWASIVFE